MCTASLIGDLINFLLANIISCKIVVKEIQLQNSLTRENCFICVLGVVLYLNSELFLQMGGFQRRHSISGHCFSLRKRRSFFQECLIAMLFCFTGQRVTRHSLSISISLMSVASKSICGRKYDFQS